MKRIMTILISCILLLSLVGCSMSGGGEKEGRYAIGSPYMKHFTVIDSTVYSVTVYANDTKVMYFIIYGDYGGGITPLYNADGTLQVYR